MADSLYGGVPSPAPFIRKRWRMARPLLATLAILVIAAAAFLFWRDVDPTLVVPSPVMPSPNAFDHFVRAENLLNKSPGLGDDFSTPTLTEKHLALVDNDNALRELRGGLDLPYMNPPIRSFSGRMPYYAGFRSLARLLLMEAQVRASEGDYNGAAQADLDAIQLGVMIPRGSLLIGKLVGIACQAIGSKDLWQEVSHLTAAQASAAAKRLVSIDARQVPFASTLQEEEWGSEAGLMEEMRRPHWRNDLLNSIYTPDTSGHVAAWLGFFRFSKRQFLGNYKGYMDAAIAREKLPYLASRPYPPLPDDPINRILLPIFLQADFKDALCEAENSMLAVALALRAYRLDHGHCPAHLHDLCPTYLPAVPTDPFGGGRTLRYRAEGEKYVLYSVGPNGKDDGGAPSSLPADPRSNPLNRKTIEENSAGDIVAGVDTNT
ncbi:MAG: hypothetical protein LC772_03480 [Chloroflexi bacterium]|nr:hypothetical protein [Chloroflexota bacterium]